MNLPFSDIQYHHGDRDIGRKTPSIKVRSSWRRIRGPPIIGDKAWSEAGQYVRTNFPDFSPICSDQIRHSRKFSNFVRIAHLASKNSIFVRIGPSGLKKQKFCSDQQFYLATYYLLSSHPLSPPTSTFLASCYNSFDCHQYILKFYSQFIENLEMIVIKGECSVILAECG